MTDGNNEMRKVGESTCKFTFKVEMVAGPLD